jgi:hypothetical protein
MSGVMNKLHRRDPVRFFKDIKAYEADLAADDRDPAAAELRRRGICVLPDFVPPDQVAAIRAGVEGPLRDLHAGAPAVEGRSTAYSDYGTYSLIGVQDHFEACRAFVEDARILDVVDRYSRGEGVSYSCIAELRAEPRRNELVDDWHTDTWRFRFKAMLYLTDVTPATAPLRYLAGSHKGADWRWAKFVSAYAADSTDRVWAHRMRSRAAAAQADNPRFEPVTCTAPAGTVILFDTRGIHGGTTLREGERLILNHTFAGRDQLRGGI